VIQTDINVETTTATEPKHVALMLRISRDKGENEDTLQNHRETLAEYAANNSLTFDIYAEIISGGITEIEDRPELQRMVANIEKYEAILCISLDRLARNGVVSQQIKQLCIDYDIKIITPAQTFDLANNQQDRLLYDISSTFAVLEYETIAKRNKLNKISRSKRGEHVSGNVPFGYVRNNETKRLEIVEEEAKMIRYIFKLHAEGYGAYKIRDILNDEGYKSAKGKVVSLPSVRRILKNEAYRGAVVFHDRKKMKEGGKYVYKIIETVVCENAHPAIIESAEWYRAKQRIEARAEKAEGYTKERKSKNATHMLKDLLYCGCCGKKMLTLKDSKSGEIYIKVCDYLLPNSTQKCGNSGIQLKYVTEYFATHIKQYREETKKRLEQILANDTSTVEIELQANIEHIEKHEAETQKEYDNLKRLAIKGIYTDEELLAEKQQLTDRLQTLERALEEARAKLADIDLKGVTKRLESIIDILENFEHEDPETQNEHLKTFIKRVRYSRVMPPEIKALAPQKDERKYFPFQLEVEYI
jgi:site-specific DNA recombinase